MHMTSVIRIVALVSLCFGSLNAGAVVINTLDGVTYEWLELTATTGMSRDQVEAELLNPASSLYGYQYASRAQVESLLLTYADYDGVTGYHADPAVVSGMVQYFADFGVNSFSVGNGINSSYDTVDGYTVNFDYMNRSQGYFGLTEECDGAGYTCFSFITLQFDVAGTPTMVQQWENYGWNADGDFAYYPNSLESASIGSYLVRNVVPLPAAVWLFVSALAGLGLLRRA